MVGASTAIEPLEASYIHSMLNSDEVSRAVPSLQLVSIPAERRMVSYGHSPFTLVSLDPSENVRMMNSQGHGMQGQANYLDDHEFENYARTLCLAAYLPDRNGNRNEAAGDSWRRFKTAIDALLSPKYLVPLTQEDPSNLRVQMPGGIQHGVAELSSGERQALIIVSRVFRAGERNSQIIIDEPDAYLHPSLCTKLLSALQAGVADGGSLILATHSPAVLDSIDPKAIYRLGHGRPPEPVLSQDNLLELYRSAGFRASAVTQADMLLIAEGEFDTRVLGELCPELRNASVSSAGGRDQVIRNLEALGATDLPVVAVVDADILAPTPNSSVLDSFHVWPCADLEGVLLSDANFLQAALSAGIFKSHIDHIDGVNKYLQRALEFFQSRTVVELATKRLRAQYTIEWPSPKDSTAREKLIGLLGPRADNPERVVSSAFEEANSIWNDSRENLWRLVRGKYVLSETYRDITRAASSGDFISLVLARAPRVAAVEDFRGLLRRKLAERSPSAADLYG